MTDGPLAERDVQEFKAYLRGMTDRQVQGVYDKEKAAGRLEYARLAVSEAERRGIALQTGNGS